MSLLRSNGKLGSNGTFSRILAPSVALAALTGNSQAQSHPTPLQTGRGVPHRLRLRLHRRRRLVGLRLPRQRRESWFLTNSTRQFRYK
jgi:hypothetical protein